jgi:acetyltransferase-like isoleucine patch superfamily enzyme
VIRRLIGAAASACLRLASLHDEARLLKSCRRTGRVRLRMPVTIYSPEELEIGDQVDIGEFTHIRANGGVRIGSRVLIASHVIITSRSHPVALPRYGVVEDAPIAIEDDVWIGAGAIMLPGITVGRGAVVAAGAVVTRSVEPFTVVAGVPARQIGQIPASDRKLS